MELIEKRRSIRKYKDTAVENELILKLIRSASLAPSGNNTQPWHFIIVDDVELKEKIAKVSHNQKWMLSAPVFIICVADIRSRIKNEDKITLDENSKLFELKQIIRDTAISIQHLVLEAVDNDLGTCWVAWYTQDEVRPILGIPDDKFVVGIVTVGYADEVPKQRPRKNIEELIHRNKWKE
jgi:nitroreductase